MDRNSAIGMVLIAALLMLYFYLSPTPPPQKLNLTDSTSVAQTPKKNEAALSVPSIDSAVVRSYGNLGNYLVGNEEITAVENADLKLQFSNNAILKNLELKNFKTYTQQPLFLINNGNNSFALRAQYEGKEVDLYKLFYQVEKTKKADTTIITYSATIGTGTSLKHIYSIPAAGFEIGYKLESNGLNFGGKNLSFHWRDAIALQEKDMKDSRGKTTINYYLTNDKHDYLNETTTDPVEQALAEPVKWASIKQKFFISGIIAKNSFSGGDLKMTTNINDPAVVKNAQVELFIPTEDVTANKAAFTYFFGPNDYKVISEVTPGFSKNLSLGWPPMLWVNKFMVIPAFKFLESFVGNYGLIIVLLVLMVKLLLLPLSYSSYLGMAKMRLLKPETDAIKEKNGDNMAQAQQDTMKLYKQVGVNPFSGCIPLLVQMPFLFALFYFFPISIELRQKSFLWAEDLSTYDSILNLPFEIPFYGAHVSLFVLLMTASTIIYTWQNNQMTAVTGPMKTMGYIMPVVFLFVLNSFAAGLSFYYFVSNLVTFSQQAIIKRFVDEDKIKAIMEENRKKAAANGGTGSKSKFMAKLEEAMKASEEAKKAAQAKKKK